jgi:MFS family permease
VPDQVSAGRSPRVLAARWPALRLGGLWRHGNFLRLWSAQAVSALGSQITLLALPLTALLVLHAKPYEVALLATAGSLPTLAVGIPAGVWVDRVRRRRVMIAADLGRAAMLASAPVAYGLGILTLPHLYVVAVVNGSFSVLFEIASQAYLPSVVSRAQLIEANAKFEASRVIAWSAGPGAGGGLVSLVTAPVALLADAASFVASACLIGSVSGREERPPVMHDRAGELREGGRYVLGDRYLRPLLLGHALANLALGLVWAIVIVYAVRELGLTAAVVGVVLSLGQIGGFAGAVFGRRIAERLGVGPTVVTALFLFGPATLLLAVASRKAAIVFLALGWILENLARALYSVSATSIRQALVPDRLQARATGFTTTAGTGAFPLGTAIGGALAGAFGLRQAMLAGAVIGLLPFVPVAFSPVRSLRGLPKDRDPYEPKIGPSSEDAAAPAP